MFSSRHVKDGFFKSVTEIKEKRKERMIKSMRDRNEIEQAKKTR